MRSIVYSAAAGIMLFPAYQGFDRGDSWFGWSFVACALLLFLAPALLATGVPLREAEPSPLDPWLPFPVNAPTVSSFCPSRETETSPNAGAIGAAPANRGR